ncbi:MAG: hypothetical protein HKM06_08815 [Spirochaetales bacterium]|nr:hypothetical protein [Spirochaetales bacterium]
MFLLGSCSFWNTFAPLAITGYSPSGSTLEAASPVSVSVSFNTDPDHAKAEGAFSLTGDGNVVPGIYSWSGSTMYFQPFQPLSVGPLYTLSVSSAAETSLGNSLMNELHHQFRLGASPGRPSVLSLSPADNSTVSNPRTPLVFTFNQPINEDSALASMSFSPSFNFTQTWSPDAKVWTLTPQSDWPADQDLEVLLTASTLFNQGRQAMGQNFSSHFRYQPTGAVPLNLLCVTQDNLPPLLRLCPPPNSSLGPSTIQTGWPIDSDLVLNFSKPVVLSSLGALLSVPEGITYTLMPDHQLASASPRLHFTVPLPWNKVLGFALQSGVLDTQGLASTQPVYFWIKTDSPQEFPPAVTLSEWKDSAQPLFAPLVNLSNQKIAGGTGTLRLIVAQGTATIFSLSAFLDCFSISGTGGYAFTPTSVSVTKDPESTSTQTLWVVDIPMTVTTPGLVGSVSSVTIRLSKAYGDDHSNVMAGDYVLVFFAS